MPIAGISRESVDSTVQRRPQVLNGTKPDSRIDSLSELPAIFDSAFPSWGR